MEIRNTLRHPFTRLHRSVSIAVALALIVVLSAWRYGVPVDAVVSAARPAMLDAELFGPGFLDATARAQLSPKTTGRIVELRVQSGDQVPAAMALVRLQSDSAEALLNQARGELGSARAQLASAMSELARAETQVYQTERDHNRLRALATTNPDAASAADLDLSASTLVAARADFSAARAKVAAAQFGLFAAEAAVVYQKAQLADTVLTAPFAGRVTQRLHSVGDTVGPGMGVLELVDETTVFVQARFDESVLSSLSVNAPARVTFREGESTEVSGRVVRIDRVVDTETRQFTAEIMLQSLPQWWALGQRADVHVRASVPAAATLSRPDVLWNEDGAFVWVVRGGRAQRQPVTIGLSSYKLVQIVSGLAAEDRVIASSVRLYPGRRVYSAG